MKRIIILAFAILFTLCGCQNDNTVSQVKESVKINLPKDNTVNGYRIESADDNDMPDKISGIDVSPNNNSQDTKSEASVSSSKNNSSETDATNGKNITYCGNKNSKKFHKSTCGAVKNTKEENKVFLSSKDDFLAEGYVACKLCKP